MIASSADDGRSPWRRLVLLTSAASAQTRSRDEWLALAKGGFAVPAGQTAVGLLTEMNPLLASPDPVLRDEVAYSAAERWIVRDKVVAPDDLRRLLALWSANLDDGLGTAGDDRVFTRSFSALCLSLIAARDVAAPFLSRRRGAAASSIGCSTTSRASATCAASTPTRGWMHTPAHTADAFKFLARNRHFAPANLGRLLDAIRAKLESQRRRLRLGRERSPGLGAARRRPPPRGRRRRRSRRGRRAGCRTTRRCGPAGRQVDPVRFARVENAKQILRSLAVDPGDGAGPDAVGREGAPHRRGRPRPHALIEPRAPESRAPL